MALIDTHSIVEDLIAAGFAKSQAEALTRLKILHYEDLATKKDLQNLELVLSKDIKNLNKELTKETINLNDDLKKVEVSLEKLIRSEMSTMKWILGIIAAVGIMILSLQFGK